MITVLNFEQWKNIIEETTIELYGDTIKDRYSDYVKMVNDKNEHVKTHGIEKCHCNHCIEAIEEYKGFKKYDMFEYKGVEVYISSFCPLEYCKDIFISGNGGDWLSIEGANRYLKLINKSKLDC